MPLIPMPPLSRGTAHVVRLVVVSPPVVIVAVFAAVILFLGLFMGEERRKYALRAAQWAGQTMRAMTGLPAGPSDERES